MEGALAARHCAADVVGRAHGRHQLTLAFIPVVLVLAVIVGVFLIVKAFYVG